LLDLVFSAQHFVSPLRHVNNVTRHQGSSSQALSGGKPADPLALTGSLGSLVISVVAAHIPSRIRITSRRPELAGFVRRTIASQFDGMERECNISSVYYLNRVYILDK
jgi:hypothetical protein